MSIYYPEIREQGKYVEFAINATEDLVAAVAGKRFCVYGFFYYSDADITTEIRFKTSTKLIGGLIAKGSVGMNFTTLKPPLSGAGEAIEAYLSAAGNIKGWIIYGER